MTKPPHFTRRGAILTGASVAGTIAAGSRATAAPEPEYPWQRAQRLAAELADALSEIEFGRWHAHVEPTGGDQRSVYFLQAPAQPVDPVDHHAQALLAALNDRDGGGWRMNSGTAGRERNPFQLFSKTL